MSAKTIHSTAEMMGAEVATPVAHRPSLPWLIPVLTLVFAASHLMVPTIRRLAHEQMTFSTPAVDPVDVTAIWIDQTPLVVSVAGLWEAEWPVTAQDVFTQDTLWQRMRLPDWNRVPPPFRERGLEAMLRRYGHIVADPGMWDRMSARDWDRVPQPMRTLAYRRMVAYWCGYYGIGREYQLPPRLVSDTVAAIVMYESWFEHRATAANGFGGRDIGLAQASPYARQRMDVLFRDGRVDVQLAESDYFNPWAATRFAAIWTGLLLGEADGDLDKAVRAYHRGTRSAYDERGTTYVDAVNARLGRFIRNHEAPPAWDFVWRRGRALFGV